MTDAVDPVATGFRVVAALRGANDSKLPMICVSLSA